MRTVMQDSSNFNICGYSPQYLSKCFFKNNECWFDYKICRSLNLGFILFSGNYSSFVHCLSWNDKVEDFYLRPEINVDLKFS